MEFGNQGIDRELAFDDVVTQDVQEFVILKPGEYEFKVKEIEKDRHDGKNEKEGGLPSCNMVRVYLEVNSPQGQATVRDNIYLHSRVEWRISAFFGSIGMKKKGESLKMNWNAVIGKTGRAKFTTNEFNGKTYNNVDRYILPNNFEVYDMDSKQQTWTPGSF